MRVHGGVEGVVLGCFGGWVGWEGLDGLDACMYLSIYVYVACFIHSSAYCVRVYRIVSYPRCMLPRHNSSNNQKRVPKLRRFF